MVKVLSNVTKQTERQIVKCLSSMKVCGKKLRKAHYYLGQQLGLQIKSELDLDRKRVGVLIMMRAGLPFGMGLADQLESSNDVEILFSSSYEIDCSKYEYIIIVDAVINTGKTILDIIKKLDSKKIIIATNVISQKYICNFESFDTFAIRISLNSFEGGKVQTISNGKGPDTGDRLFCSSFFD